MTPFDIFMVQCKLLNVTEIILIQYVNAIIVENKSK